MINNDWTGNNKSVFATLGASSHSKDERQEQDYYATDPIAIDKLASKFNIPQRVWECSCGEGHLSERLRQLGHDVYSSDLIDRGYGDVADFLSWDSEAHRNEFSCIITNPPYKYATEFILKALDLLKADGYAIFLLKTTALESRSRYEKIYRFTPPKKYLHSSTGFYVRRTGISRRRRGLEEVRCHMLGLSSGRAIRDRR